jgi:hypothetical protein
MGSNLFTTLLGLIFFVAFVVVPLRALLKRISKGTGRTVRWYLFRLGVTGAAALVLIALMDPDNWAPMLLFWAAFYWLWKYWDYKRGAGIPAHTPSVTAPPVVPLRLTPAKQRPRWRRVLHRTISLTAQALGVIALLTGLMVASLGYYEWQAKVQRNKVRAGMTIDEVLPLVHGGCSIRTHAVLPDDVKDDDLLHYVALYQRPNGTFGCNCGPNREFRQMTEPEAAELMKQKMSDGYEWRWRYTFINDTPMHFSFTVEFGKDGRVKDVTNVWGWD